MSKGMSKWGKILVYSYMLLTCAISLLPLVWVFLSSLKADPIVEHGFSWPASPTVDGYVNVFTKLHVLDYFWNSFKVVSVSVLLSISMISLSAYVIARMDFKGKGLVSAMIYSTLFIPATAMTFPIYY